MYLMRKKDVEKQINDVNDFIEKCLWMDFEFCSINSGKVVVSGTVDTSFEDYSIIIQFEQPYFISTLFTWEADVSKPFIQLANIEEEKEMNEKYCIEEGNYIFKINAEGFKFAPIIIVAKTINCTAKKDNPFQKN